MGKSKFLVIALIPLVLSIGMAPVLSYGNIFGTPKTQMDDGVATGDVLCRYGLDLMQRPTGSVACVQPSSTGKLTGMGWKLLVRFFYRGNSGGNTNSSIWKTSIILNC